MNTICDYFRRSNVINMFEYIFLKMFFKVVLLQRRSNVINMFEYIFLKMFFKVVLLQRRDTENTQNLMARSNLTFRSGTCWNLQTFQKKTLVYEAL